VNAVLYVICAVLAWIVALNKIRQVVRGGRENARIVLCVALVLLAATMTVAVPAVWLGIDAWTGVPNLSALLSQGLAATFAVCIHLMVLLLHRSPEVASRTVRRHLALVATILSVLTVLFLRIPPMEEAPTDFVVRYAGQPQVATYLGVYVVAFGAVQVRNTRLCWRYARADVGHWLRIGLHMVAFASALGLVYSVIRALDIVGQRLGLQVGGWEAVARLVIFSGVVLASLGCTAPSWGRKLSAAATWAVHYVAYARLYRLWAVMYRAVPDIALEPPPSRARDLLAAVARLRFLLLRRVIEINDAMLVLRAYLDPGAFDEASRWCAQAGLTGAPLRTAVEACLLRRALRRMVPGVEARNTLPVAPPDAPAAADLSSEVRRMLDIARAFDDSPLVRAFADLEPRRT
jgi:hypothetical protein